MIATKLLDTVQYIRLVRDYMLRESVPASMAVDALMSGVHVTAEAHAELFRAGAIARVNDEEHHERGGAVAMDAGTDSRVGDADRASGSGPRVVGAHFRERAHDAALTLAKLGLVRLAGADGCPRTLLEFSVADWEAFSERTLRQLHAWRLQRAFAVHALALLKEHVALTVAGLPEKARLVLGKEAEGIWV